MTPIGPVIGICVDIDLPTPGECGGSINKSLSANE